LLPYSEPSSLKKVNKRQRFFNKFLMKKFPRHFGTILLLCATVVIFKAAHCDDRPESDAADAKKKAEQKAFLDYKITNLIYTIPSTIDHAKVKSDAALRFDVRKKFSWGWSIMLASWKDILSDYIENNRTLGNLERNVVYNYGFLASYGVGFGYPWLLGLGSGLNDSDNLKCGSEDFLKILRRYGLQNGINGLLAQNVSKNSILSLIGEYKLFVGLRLDCILSRFSEEVESAEVEWQLQKLVKALEMRLAMESGSPKK
jgi:hypothetical protein